MRTRNAVAVAAAFLLLLTASACSKKVDEKTPSAKAAGIAWMGYTEGMEKSRSTGKPVMVDFFTTWCKYCVLLEDTTYKDPGIISTLNDNFIAIKVNAEGSAEVVEKGKKMTERDLAASYKVTGFPTIWFFDGKGAPIGPLPGYNSAADFKPVLDYISGGAYSKGVKFADYLKEVQKNPAPGKTAK